MTREEMIAQARLIRSRDRFGPVTEAELAAAGAEQRELELPLDGGRRLTVFELRPQKGLPCPAPLVINYHGGGFIKGRADRDQLYCGRLANALGCLVWDVDYSLAPEEPFPRAVQESCGVVLYAFGHAAQLGIDPGRIVLAGHSAGGNLVAAACLQLIRAGAPRPRAALMEYFPADMSADPLEKLTPAQRADEWWTGRAKVERQYTLFYAAPKELRDPLVSPAFAAEEELAAFPESLVISAGQDSLCAETEAFGCRLAKAGVTVTLRRFRASPHGFTTNRTGEWEQAFRLHCDFIRRHLETKE